MATFYAFLGGISIGLIGGIQYILWLQRRGYILPINPYALPIVEKSEQSLGTILTPQGTRVKSLPPEETSGVTKIKNSLPESEGQKYI